MDCEGCGGPVEAPVSVWLRSPLGISCRKAHEECRELARARLSEQPAVFVERPVSREERERAKRKAPA